MTVRALDHLAPAAAEASSGFLTAADGTRLFHRQWHPPGPIHAAIAVVHGHGEHGGRYGNLVDHLVPRGYVVWAADLRGNGRSDGPRGHLTGWSEYRDDLRLVLGAMRSAHLGVPLFAWGHSLGALVVLEAVLRAPLGLTGAVASAPPLVPTVTGRWLPALARLVSPLWPGWSVRLGLDAAGLSREPGVVEANRADPLNHRRISARLGTEARTAIRWTMNNADMLRTPLLIVHGGADRLSSPAGSRAFMTRATFPDRQLLEYEGGYHELHNDTIRNTVLGDVERWLRRHV